MGWAAAGVEQLVGYLGSLESGGDAGTGEADPQASG